jgi:NitT/TauT family transport system substrate-binding protein
MSTAAVGTGSAATTKLTEVTIVLNWLVEPPHGGYFAALADGLYTEQGLNVHLTPGGPNVAGYAMLGAGKTEFAQLDGAGLLSGREQGIPLVAVFAELQDTPQVLMFHKDKPVKGFEDLAGRKVAVTPGVPYWEYISAKYKLRGKLTQVNYTGQSAAFLQDQTMVQQGYAIGEPFAIKKQANEDVGMLRVSESGFNPYGVLATTEAYRKEHGDIVRRIVLASQKGWQRYVENPAKYASALKGANRDLDDAFLAWSAQALVPFVRGASSEGKSAAIGSMTEARWQALYTALREAAVLKKEQDVKQAFTTEFLAQ